MIEGRDSSMLQSGLGPSVTRLGFAARSIASGVAASAKRTLQGRRAFAPCSGQLKQTSALSLLHTWPTCARAKLGLIMASRALAMLKSVCSH